MKIIGISRIVSNHELQAIGAFWQEFFTNNTSALIPHQISSNLFCVYTDYEGDYQKPYKMIIGHEVSSLKDIPHNMEGREFEYDHYDQVTVRGEMPQAILEAWQKIWANNITRAYTLDFQRHNPDGSVDIFVEYIK